MKGILIGASAGAVMWAAIVGAIYAIVGVI